MIDSPLDCYETSVETIVGTLIQLDKAALPGRIEKARSVITQRLLEPIGKPDHNKEIGELRDALHTLRSLQNIMNTPRQ